MSWKNVKEHYKIDHIVHVRNGNICIGSSYMSALIVIEDGVPYWYRQLSTLSNDDLRSASSSGWMAMDRGQLSASSNDDLLRIILEMKSDIETLKSLIEKPDTFKRSLVVYTYTGGEIIEKHCEMVGYPNVTHDGELMYDNTHSVDRDQVLGWAVRNAKAGIHEAIDAVAEYETRLDKARNLLAAYRADLERLENGATK